MLIPLALFAAAVFTGARNALAGGGSFITFPALPLTGLEARAVNITSTIAPFPGQVSTGWAGRRMAGRTPDLSLRALLTIGLFLRAP